MSNNTHDATEWSDDDVDMPFNKAKGGKVQTPQKRPTPINTSAARATGTNQVASTADTNISPVTARHFSGATALYPSSIWSPSPADEATQSATMPTKAAWEGFGDPQHGISQTDFTFQSLGPKTAPLQGLGATAGFRVSLPSNAATQYRYNEREIFKPKTSPLGQDDGLLTSNTFPLMQHPFGTPRDSANQPRLPSKLAVVPVTSEQSTNPKTRAPAESNPAAHCSLNTQAEMDGKASPAGQHDDDTHSYISNPYDEKEGGSSIPFIASDEACGGSIVSQVTNVDSKTHGKQSGQKKFVFEQESHPVNWARQTSDKHADSIGEAFPGAREVLRTLNASHCTISSGARLICIKSDHVDNIIWSIKRGVWCAMDKVGQRIMRLWNDRPNSGDTIYFIFSVNGQKSYAGLAQMSGPWTKGGNFEDWIDNTNGTRTFGSIPIVWKYVKNVSYEWLKDIKHDHNTQPIVNMWNGMHFPHETGLKVIEVYVTKAHFTNILAWRKDSDYKPHKNVAHSSQLDPRLKKPDEELVNIKATPLPYRAPKGGRGGRAGGNAMKSVNWRQGGRPQPQGATPNTQEKKRVQFSHMNDSIPNQDGSNSPVHQSGRMVRLCGAAIGIDQNSNKFEIQDPEHSKRPTLVLGGRMSPMPPRANMNLAPPRGNMNLMPSQDEFHAYNQELRDRTQASFADMRGRGRDRGRDRGRGSRAGFQGPVGDGFHPHAGGNASHQQPTYVSPAVQQQNVGLGIVFPHSPRVAQGTFPAAVNSPAPVPIYAPRKNAAAALRYVAPFAGFEPAANFNSASWAVKHSAAADNMIRAGPQFNGNGQHPYGAMPDIAGSPSHLQENFHNSFKASAQDSQIALVPNGRDTHPIATNQRAKAPEEEKLILGEDKKLIYDNLMRRKVEADRQKMEIDLEIARMAYEAHKQDADSAVEKVDSWDCKDWQSTSSEGERNISPVRSQNGGTILRSVSRHQSPDTKARKREAHRVKHATTETDSVTDSEMRREVSKLVDTPEASLVNEASISEAAATSSGGVALD